MKKLVLALLTGLFGYSVNAQDYHFEKSIKTPHFTNGVSDEVIYIDLGNQRLWGWIEITITGGFSYQNTIGKYTKRFQIGRNKDHSETRQSSEVPTLHGEISSQWKIGDIEVDANNHMRIPIYHLVTTRNNLLVTVEGHSLIAYDVNNITVSPISVLANSEEQEEVHYKEDFNVLGNLGIGTKDTQGFKLGVQGKIATEEIKVAQYNAWPDYVFEDAYELPTLEEVESQIDSLGHLPNIPSADQVEDNGFYLGEMNAKLLEKIEELTLYTIEQEKKIKSQEEEINRLKTLEQRIIELERKLKK